MRSIYLSILTRTLMAGAASLALIMMAASAGRAETVTVQGADGAAGADGVNPGDNGIPGADGESVTASAGSVHPVADPVNQASAAGGTGGPGGRGGPPGYFDGYFEVGGDGGDGGNGGTANATAVTTITSGSGRADASSFGGNGGFGGSGGGGFAVPDGSGGVGGSAGSSATAKSRRGDVTVSASATGGEGGGASAFGNGGNGGSGMASANGFSRGGNATVSASATGGAGGVEDAGFGGSGGSASATSKAFGGSGGASSSAYATGGAALSPGGQGGGATATANAAAIRGGLAIAQASATAGGHFIGNGNYGADATSAAKSILAVANVRSTDEAEEAANSYSPSTDTVTTNSVAQAAGSGQSFITPDNGAFAFSTVLPDKADVATLIDGASTVASAFLGPNETVFGTSILGIGDEIVESFTYTVSSTFDFDYQGDLRLGLIDGGGEFSLIINGVQTLAENFVADTVINLGSDFGPNIDLKIVLEGSGDFVLGGGPRALDLGDDAGRLRGTWLHEFAQKAAWAVRQRAVSASETAPCIDHGFSPDALAVGEVSYRLRHRDISLSAPVGRSRNAWLELRRR